MSCFPVLKVIKKWLNQVVNSSERWGVGGGIEELLEELRASKRKGEVVFVGSRPKAVPGLG